VIPSNVFHADVCHSLGYNDDGEDDDESEDEDDPDAPAAVALPAAVARVIK
jgi:hypothetical protein